MIWLWCWLLFVGIVRLQDTKERRPARRIRNGRLTLLLAVLDLNLRPCFYAWILTANEISLLDSRPQPSSTNDIQQLEFFIPAQACRQEVTVEAQRVARVDGVVASETQTRHGEVALRVHVSEERVALGYFRQSG